MPPVIKLVGGWGGGGVIWITMYVCLDDMNHKPFVTKLGMKVHHYELECHVKKKIGVPSSRSRLTEGSYDRKQHFWPYFLN